MDPEAVLQSLEASIDECRWGDAVEELHSYYHWRLRGGFEPRNGDARAEALSMELADALDNLHN